MTDPTKEGRRASGPPGGRDARPPSLGRLYAAVLLFLALQVLVFYLFTNSFR